MGVGAGLGRGDQLGTDGEAGRRGHAGRREQGEGPQRGIATRVDVVEQFAGRRRRRGVPVSAVNDHHAVEARCGDALGVAQLTATDEAVLHRLACTSEVAGGDRGGGHRAQRGRVSSRLCHLTGHTESFLGQGKRPLVDHRGGARRG